jgi:patatin-related protein
VAALPEQELRIAVVMTGGVSLAIWMGGVATELDQLIRARGGENGVYADLLALTACEPRIDVVSGTSAGGINGTLLAAAVARRRPLDGLRKLWLDTASFTKLLRSPFEADPPSVLKGDEYFGAELHSAFKKLLGDGQVEQGAGHPVELLVTTTLLSGEDARLVDDFGTLIPDVRHAALMRFDEKQLQGGAPLMRRLALAARSSASFPVAFEPSWIPCGDERADDAHPPMEGCASFRRDHHVIDGGVLVNRPLSPAVDAVFAQRASGEDVRRVLLYVVPDPGESVNPEPEERDGYKLTDVALRSLVTIPRVQSIASDIDEINEQNRRVREQRGVRDRVVMRWFPAGDIGDLLTDYRDVRAARHADELLAELTLRWAGQDFKPFDRQRTAADIRKLYCKALPQEPTPDPATWGLESVELAAEVALDLARRGFGLAEPGTPQRDDLAAARKHVHEALAALRAARAERPDRIAEREENETFERWATRVAPAFRADDATVVRNAAETVAGALVKTRDAVQDLNPELAEIARRLAPGEDLARLFELEVLLQSVGLGDRVVEQELRLLQVSANTRDAFGLRSSAADKLTGMHLAHFAAFYKPSWRANDWLWGRLDGSGWLVQLLLEPERLRGVANVRDEIERIALGPPGVAHDWLDGQLDREAVAEELSHLADDPPPKALPQCALAIARRLQLAILADELPQLAAAVQLDEAAGALTEPGTVFLGAWGSAPGDRTPAELVTALDACRFAAPGFGGEQGSDLLARDGSTAAAATAAALAGGRSGLPGWVTKMGLLRTLRGVALALYALVGPALAASRALRRLGARRPRRA